MVLSDATLDNYLLDQVAKHDLYEAPCQPETLQFYKIKGVDRLSHQGMEFNRELRRVGCGYQVDRKKLLLD
jgi:hypothetical protein